VKREGGGKNEQTTGVKSSMYSGLPIGMKVRESSGLATELVCNENMNWTSS